MATPMTSSQVVAQLKKWGIRYVEIPGWATHNRNSKGAWGGINGFIWHHTGASVSAANAKTYASSTLYKGLADLPGPLCHFSIGLDGTVFLVGWGRANHAGGGDPAVLQHVINEDYNGQLKPTKGNSNGVDGNAHFYGVEIQYSGSKAMADVQYKAALKLSAAILDFHVERDGWGKDAKSIIAHGEWSSDKWDPGYAPGKIMAMPGVRTDVKATLAAGPGGTTAPQKEDDDMPAADVWKADVIDAAPPPYNNSDWNSGNKTWSAGYALSTTMLTGRKVEKKVDALTALVEQLAAKVDALTARLPK
ncbi:peptidoglycan recognition protein family protein [Streptomyces sp. NPDC004532]